MHFYSKLYLDDKTKDQYKKIRRKLKYHAGLFNTYIIAVSEGRDYFDLIPGFVFFFFSYPVKDMLVLGLADGYDSALDLATKAFNDLTEEYGTVYFKEDFLKDKDKKFSGFKG